MNTNVNQIKSQACDITKGAIKEGQDEFNSLKDRGGKVVDELSSKAQKTAKAVENDTKALVNSATDYARSNPLEALGIAVVAGIILKRFLR